MPSKLILIRHGEVEERFQFTFIGTTDAPLSDEGRSVMKKFRPLMEKHRGALFLSSPLQRAAESFRLATEGLQVRAGVHEELREIDFGAWDGRGYEEIRETFPEEHKKWHVWSPAFAFPGGDSHQSFSQRIKRCAADLKAREADTVVAFTHGGVIMFLLCELLGIPHTRYRSFRVRRGSRTTVDVSGPVGVLEEINYVPN